MKTCAPRQSAWRCTQILWERACSRKRLSRRPVFCGCTGLFASKLAPTGPRRCRGRHAAVFDDDMRPNTEALGVVHKSCGSELARESDCPDALFFVSALAYSRASSLPQDRGAAGDGTPPYLMTTCAPTLKRLALYAGFVGASLLAKAIVQTPCFMCLHWPIREQARSHRTDALPGTARRRI